LDENTRKIIRHGRRVRELLKQSEQQPLRMSMQISAMKSVTAGLLDTVPLEKVGTTLQLIQNRVTNQLRELCEQIERGEQLHDDDWQQLLHTARDTLVNQDIK
jgi:F-type H+-transporting ATPase subunit alpha